MLRERDPARSCARPASRVPDLRTAATRFAAATPRLTTVARQAQPARQHGRLQPERRRAGRAPPGRDEGYLYWVGWLGHNGDTVFSAGDGNGFYRRIYLTVGCDQLADDRRRPSAAARADRRSSSPASPAPSATCSAAVTEEP